MSLSASSESPGPTEQIRLVKAEATKRAHESSDAFHRGGLTALRLNQRHGHHSREGIDVAQDHVPAIALACRNGLDGLG